jgi:hypothetical protein
LPLNRPKQIGLPPFNTGRENLPVRSGADNLMALKERKVNVRLSKRLVAKSEQIGFLLFKTGREKSE